MILLCKKDFYSESTGETLLERGRYYKCKIDQNAQYLWHGKNNVILIWIESWNKFFRAWTGDDTNYEETIYIYDYFYTQVEMRKIKIKNLL